jgi:hypothetical protein
MREYRLYRSPYLLVDLSAHQAQLYPKSLYGKLRYGGHMISLPDVLIVVCYLVIAVAHAAKYMK